MRQQRRELLGKVGAPSDGCEAREVKKAIVELEAWTSFCEAHGREPAPRTADASHASARGA